MYVGQKLEIRFTSVTFFHDATPEETMQLRRLIKSLNESLEAYMFGKFKFWNFQGPRADQDGLKVP